MSLIPVCPRHIFICEGCTSAKEELVRAGTELVIHWEHVMSISAEE